MKKILILFAFALSLFSCEKSEDMLLGNTDGEKVVLTGYSSIETRTHFGTPTANDIPYFWSSGDYIWWGSVKSNPITENCRQAQFTFKNPPSSIGVPRIFYNMTGSSKTAKVLAEQTADGNLGNDGDFGYAEADEFGIFCLEHKTSYIWFNTTTTDKLPKLVSISVTAAGGVYLAGDCVFDYAANEWSNSVSNGSSTIVLNFDGGVELKSSNEGIFATMVTLPAAVSGKKLTITYTFADGSTYTEVKTPAKNFAVGATQRISTSIKASNLVEPAPEYVLKVLTFEDEDAKFEPYTLDYVNNWEGADIRTWSDLIDTPPYGGPLTYGDYMNTKYTWWDENNTELTHTFPDNYAYCFWGGGHAISHYWGVGYADEDRDKHIAKYYGEDYAEENAGDDQMLGWFNLQLMIPHRAHSGDNFCVHYGYKDFFSYITNLPELSFADGVARVIDHMWVTNTNYTLNQLYNGVKSEAGNTFGGNWEGLTETAWMKLIAQGFDDVDADANADPISQVEFYLVKGTNVVTDWQKWDLSGLGKVAKVRFNFAYSEEMGGRYGFTIPGYFAYDDVAVRFEK
ncbi:MAG: DUF4465 domain-containing protein [Bacteroidales bacterium]|nr:DUF4465 domain-containing protein [Bacteroidales bacterium]